jgi:hypothetical protein
VRFVASAYDEAISLIVNLAEDAILLAKDADLLTVDDLPRFLEKVIKDHPLADRLRVVEYGDVVYEYGDVYVEVDFNLIWENQAEPYLNPDSSVTGIPDDN